MLLILISFNQSQPKCHLFVAVTGKHLHVAIRAYRVTRCHPPLQPIPERSTVQHQMTGVPGRNVAVVTVARHRCVRDDESCSLRCEPPPPCRQGSPVISCVTELNDGTGSEGRDGMVRVLYGEDPGAQGYEGGQPGRADIRADSSPF